MTKLSKDKMKEICRDVLTNVLTTAANNLVIEAAICANSTEKQGFSTSLYGRFRVILRSIKQLIIDPDSYVTKFPNKEKELDTYIKAINGELARARAQAMIYLDTLVLDSNESNVNKETLKEKETNWRPPTQYFLRGVNEVIYNNSISKENVKIALKTFGVKEVKFISDDKRKAFIDFLKANYSITK